MFVRNSMCEKVWASALDFWFNAWTHACILFKDRDEDDVCFNSFLIIVIGGSKTILYAVIWFEYCFLSLFTKPDKNILFFFKYYYYIIVTFKFK